MIKKLIGISLALVFGLSLVNKQALADGLYGDESDSRQIIVDKKLKPVSWSNWSDNLSLNDYAFSAEDLIDFKILVKNSGEADLTNIEVIDTFPGSVNFVFGPGSYNKDNHQLVWNIDHLNPNEEKEFKLRVQVINASELPSDGTFPVINKVKVTAESGETDQDTTQFYIKGKVEQLPEAGINLALGTALALGAISTGLLSRKFGRGEILS